MATLSRTTIFTRINGIPRELKLFGGTALFMGIAFSMFDSTFNNFLNERFTMTGFERSFLEFPRELPGFLVVFVSALLSSLCSRRLGAFSLLLGAIGALLIGFLSSSYAIMTIWLFLYSMGQHLFMPISPTIGMELAEEGRAGQRLGQLNAVRNFAAILGSFLVFLGFKYLGFTFQTTFVLAAVGLLTASILMFSMGTSNKQPAGQYLQLHKEYRLYYILASLHGSRKQLFITFAPWVLVTVFQQPTQILATLMTLGGIIGIVFQPLLGWTIDHFGERRVLMTEAVILVFVCFGYGFARSFLPDNSAFLLVCACFLLDQMLFSVGMARSTYIKKIAIIPEHVQPALTASVTIDHIFSISAAILGGVIWNTFGFQYVFLMGTLIAVGNFLAARRIRIPAQDSLQSPAGTKG